MEYGVLKTRSGKEYPYEAGNNLAFGHDGAVFNGMRISIPKALPHIYLDNHRDSKTAGPRITFHNSQRLLLEGDFNTHFQLFAPQRYHHLVLSILTPDVMRTLIDVAGVYDVEINNQMINIIYHKKLSLKPEKLEELTRIATQILEEVEHKLKSWNAEDEHEALAAKLTLYNQQAVKIFGRYYGVERVAAAACLIVALMFYTLGFTAWQERTSPEMWLGIAAMIFPGFPVMLYYIKNR